MCVLGCVVCVVMCLLGCILCCVLCVVCVLYVSCAVCLVLHYVAQICTEVRYDAMSQCVVISHYATERLIDEEMNRFYSHLI
jgi:hypothetical protein